MGYVKFDNTQQVESFFRYIAKWRAKNRGKELEFDRDTIVSCKDYVSYGEILDLIKAFGLSNVFVSDYDFESYEKDMYHEGLEEIYIQMGKRVDPSPLITITCDGIKYEDGYLAICF